MYTVTIEYVPDGRCAEIRSLRAYLDSFAGQEISHEAFCETVYGGMETVLEPRELRVTVETNEYVGVVTTVERESTLEA